MSLDFQYHCPRVGIIVLGLAVATTHPTVQKTCLGAIDVTLELLLVAELKQKGKKGSLIIQLT